MVKDPLIRAEPVSELKIVDSRYPLTLSCVAERPAMFLSPARLLRRTSLLNAPANFASLSELYHWLARLRVAEFVGARTTPAVADSDETDPSTRLDFGITAPLRCSGRTPPGMRRRVGAGAANYRHAVALRLFSHSIIFCYNNGAQTSRLCLLCLLPASIVSPVPTELTERHRIGGRLRRYPGSV